ncbi:MAG TPA: TauD/TfdA family dioxygenase [Candidatus Angelobacter sp.]|nr:TauD/TfdA family dioxygenase [Candidatus Angelobacter sp.]
MTIQAFCNSTIGMELPDVDAKTITATEAEAIKQLVYKHKLVVFRNQSLSNEEYIAFARMFGAPQIYLQKNYHHPEHPEIFVSSNVPENGKKIGVAGTGRYWHTDYQFHSQPLPMTMLYPQVLPEGKRETYYIDMEHVHSALPEDLRSYVEGRLALHDAKWRYKITPEDIDRAVIDILAEVEKMVPPLTHPAVIQHPVTGRDILYISSGFTSGIVGLEHEENRQFMKRLFDFIEKPEHIYVHTWCYGDILLWDNRSLIHKASDTPKGEQSCSYRIGIYDGVPFYAGLAAESGAA